MKCYDKELVISGKVVRSPEQQVYKNMEDIEALEKKIQTWYASSVELTTSSNTILRSNTNVPDDVESGLLIDPVGNMFNITGGDETTLLITFYANIQGPQGETGTPGASSNDKGIYITHVEPTLNDSVYTLSTGNVDNFSTDNIPVQVNDIVIYIDSNDQPTSMFTVTSISGTTLTLSIQGTYAKGKKLYLHNINVRKIGQTNYLCETSIQIINDDNTQFTKEKIRDFLIDKGLGVLFANWATDLKWYGNVSGVSQAGTSAFVPIIGVFQLTDGDTQILYRKSDGGLDRANLFVNGSFTLVDTVITL